MYGYTNFILLFSSVDIKFYLSCLDVVHMTCKQITNAAEDLKPAVDKLLNEKECDGDFSKVSQVGTY